MTGAVAGQRTSSPETPAAGSHEMRSLGGQLARLRRSEQLQLRARHAGEWQDARSLGNLLLVRAGALAEANVTARFAHRWALLMQEKERPDLAAAVAALKAEQAAELARHGKELADLVTAERRASGALLKDRQRRERQALARRYAASSHYLIPLAHFPAMASPSALLTRARKVYFEAAGRLTTRRLADQRYLAGLPRLAFRRPGRPRD